MKYAFILAASLLTYAVPSRGDDIVRKDFGYRGKLHRNGPIFDCVITADQNPKPEDFHLQACLYLGTKERPLPLWVDAKPLLDAFGKPYEIVPEPSGARNYIYPIGPGDPSPYIVIKVAENRVVALQVSGSAPDPSFPFGTYNGIGLGASASAVKAKFGEPMQIEPSSLPGTEQWSYHPFTFSFEIKDDKVTSIRVSEDP